MEITDIKIRKILNDNKIKAESNVCKNGCKVYYVPKPLQKLSVKKQFEFTYILLISLFILKLTWQ